VSVRRRRPRRSGGASRALASLAALVCSASLLAGCTSAGDRARQSSASPSPSTSTPTSSATGPVTLRFEVYGEPQEVAAYRAVARAFTRREPNVTVDVDALPGPDAAARTLDREFRSREAPDLFLTDAARLPGLVAKRRVRPVDQLLEARGVEFGDHYERLGLEAFAASSSLQCMPSDVSPYVVYYNPALLQPSALALPGEPTPDPDSVGWSWAEFLNAVQQVSTGRVKGVYLPPRLDVLTPLLRSGGADIVDDDQQPTTLTLGDKTSRAVLSQILQLVRDPALTPTPQELADQDAVSRFAHGRLAMLVGTRAVVPRLRHARNLTFDVYPLPSLGSSSTVADVRGYCITRTSRHVREAADFLAFASSDRGASIIARSGAVVPANLDVRTSEAFEQTDRMPVNQGVYGRVIRRASAMPTAPAWPVVVRRTQPLVNRLFYAPVLDLNRVLGRMDRISSRILRQPTPSPSVSPGASPSG
jgi:multiple sugar transport system substrate-binding protein